MKIRTTLAFILLALGACSHGDSGNPLYGQLENEREFGTVLSVSQGVAAGMTPSGTSTTNTGAGTTGSLFGFGGSSGGNTSNAPSLNIGTINTLHYSIRKDNGQVIKIDQEPEAGEVILYPDQRVMIQTNNGYMHVYPADVENRFK